MTVASLALLCLSGLKPSPAFCTILDLTLSPQAVFSSHFAYNSGFLTLLASDKHSHPGLLTPTALDAVDLKRGWHHHYKGCLEMHESGSELTQTRNSYWPLVGRDEGPLTSCSTQDSPS